MILKIVFREGKSTLIDDIDNIDFEKLKRDDYPELESEGNQQSKYIYELSIHQRDGSTVHRNISSKFFIMNDQGKTIEIIRP